MAVIRGWALAALGDVAAGLVQCEQGVASYLRTGATVRLAYLRSVQADAYRQAGRRQEAIVTCDEAIARLSGGSERWLLPDLHRLKAELLSEEREGWESARREMESALQSARHQGERSLELRAALSMAQMLAQRNLMAEAKALLLPVYDGFTEGFATRDLVAAAEVLEQLS